MAKTNDSEKQKYTIRLRALRAGDAELTWKWRNRPEVREMYAGHPFFVNPEKEKIWFEKILTSDYPIVAFGIEIVEKEQLIGLSFLKDINYIHRVAEFSIFMIDKAYENRWYLRHAYFQTLDFAFYDMNLNRVWSKIYEYNRKALGLIQYFGFVKEGVIRQSAYKDGEFVNEVILSLLRKEYDVLERKEGYSRKSRKGEEGSEKFIKF
jgi:RimJ/RimL family protein N-acetyltransferase